MQIESHNPYAEVVVTASEVGSPQIEPMHAGMVRQVKVIGILLIAQALLELLQGGAMIALSFFIEFVFTLPDAEGRRPAMPAESLHFLQNLYLVIGIFSLVAAVLRFIAAMGCFLFRQRTWIIVSLFVGLISAFSGLCGLTSVGLCIYGLIVMLNPGVARAFQMVSQGRPVKEVKQLANGM